MNWVANVNTDSSSAAERRAKMPAVLSPRRADARSGPLTITAAAAISTMWGGVNSRSSPSGLLGVGRNQLLSTMSAAPKTSAAASEPV